MKREEAVKVLTAEIDRIEDNQAYEQMSKKMYEDGYKRIDAFKTAIDALHKVRKGDGRTAADHYNEGYYDAVNSNCWVLTKDKKPDLSENDVVLCYQFSKLWRGPTLVSVRAAIEQPNKFRYWMPVPKLPE